MPSCKLLALALAATLNAATAVPLSPSDLRGLRGATSPCEHGADGYLVEYNMKARRHLQADKYGRRPSPIDILFGKRAIQRADVLFNLTLTNRVAARLSDSALNDLLRDGDIAKIEDNCIIKLDPSEDATAQGVSQALSWGLDRIDSRSGTDGSYDNSGATGEGALVCACASLSIQGPRVPSPCRTRKPQRSLNRDPLAQTSSTPACASATTTLAAAPFPAGRPAAPRASGPCAATTRSAGSTRGSSTTPPVAATGTAPTALAPWAAPSTASRAA